jgi:predicted nucleic acid-binding protein
MTVVDTTVWVDYFNDISNPYTEWISKYAYTNQIVLTDLILCELLQGVRGEAQFQSIKASLAKIPLVVSHGSEIAVASARNYRVLRSRGITIRKFVDTWTATTCLEQDLSLLHHDRDYDAFEKHLGLKVIHPELKASR